MIATNHGLRSRVHGRAKTYAPPFMMLGLNVENTTSSDFRITATARYLAFDAVGSGSELRHGTVGSDPAVGAELYRPIGPTPLFIAPWRVSGLPNFIEDDAVIARYQQTVSRVGHQRRVNLGGGVRAGAYYVGAPPHRSRWGTPASGIGKETEPRSCAGGCRDSPVAPAGGLRSQVRLSRIFNGPDIVA
jgi:NTE family protein